MSSIRAATQHDVDDVIALLKSAREESPRYRDFGYNELRTRAILSNMLSNPKAIILVDDWFRGVLVGDISPDWLTDGWTATIHLVYAKPGYNGIRLIKEFKRWAKEWPQVDKLYVSTSFGGYRAETAEKLFEKM